MGRLTLNLATPSGCSPQTTWKKEDFAFCLLALALLATSSILVLRHSFTGITTHFFEISVYIEDQLFPKYLLGLQHQIETPETPVSQTEGSLNSSPFHRETTIIGLAEPQPISHFDSHPFNKHIHWITPVPLANIAWYTVYSSLGGHLGCTQLLATTNDAAAVDVSSLLPLLWTYTYQWHWWITWCSIFHWLRDLYAISLMAVIIYNPTNDT